MAVELFLRVARSDENRLSGTVRLAGESDERPFSGTLELMRVFEELVPTEAHRADVIGLAEDASTHTS